MLRQEEVGFFPVCICTVLVYLPDIGYHSVETCYYHIYWTLFSAHCICYIHIDTTSSACEQGQTRCGSDASEHRCEPSDDGGVTHHDQIGPGNVEGNSIYGRQKQKGGGGYAPIWENGASMALYGDATTPQVFRMTKTEHSLLLMLRTQTNSFSALTMVGLKYYSKLEFILSPEKVRVKKDLFVLNVFFYWSMVYFCLSMYNNNNNNKYSIVNQDTLKKQTNLYYKS